MSAQVAITQLPAAGAITGTEAVPIVQNGVTVQTTTAALAGSPVQTYTYLTVSQTPQLANSRYVGATNGLAITDGGAQGLFNISSTGALLSLVNTSAGIQVKTDSTTLTNRSIAVSGSGLGVTNGDGISGDPTLSLSGQVLNFANASFDGLVALSTSGGITSATITGTSNQITVTNGTGVGGNPTISITSNPALPGTAGVVLPSGTTGERAGSPTNGTLRYNTSTTLLEAYLNNTWTSLASGSGVTSIATGTGLTGGPITSTGTISIADTAVVAGAYTNANITVNAQGQITSAANGAAGGVTSFSAGSTGLTPSTGTTGAITLAGTLVSGNGGTGFSTYATGDLIYASAANTLSKLTAGTDGYILKLASGVPTWAAASATGVTSVAQTFTGGIVSVAGSPITTSGTLALTVAGTSGGVPYFDSATSWATSAALAASSIVVGGGAGAAPSTITTGTGVVTALGVNTGSAGAFVVNGGALGTPSSGTVTNLTGTASININGTVGATTANTGAFTTISATGVITSTLATGTAPFTVASTTQVANLNVASAGTATNATNVALAAGTGATNYITFSATATGNQPLKTNSLLTYNYTNNALTAGVTGGTF